MASETEMICNQLIKAVRAMMDPTTAPQLRLEAFTNCEHFKETSTPAMGIQCAIMLGGSPDQIIRHFGLKLLEDVIKLRWNDMTPEQKLFVKENAMNFMDKGVQDILKEPNHIKDAIARNVVEMAKREWPQHWPGFLGELQQLSTKGDAQAELVMFVMLRLVEDVAVLQTLEQNQRRKEIYQALSAEMETIFQFLLGLLERHYQAYTATNDPHLKERHNKVCQSVLATFTAFVEWAPMNHIMANDHYLVRCLCHLLNDDALKLHAAECLLAMVSWKVGKNSDRGQLLVLFKSDLMSQLFNSIQTANMKTMQGEDDQHYLLLKRLVQILVELGGQVCAVWSLKEPNCGKPENLHIYLDALLAFTNHNSLMVNYYANELWAKFCRHSDIVKDDVFKTYIPKWVEIALKKAVKVGYPSKEDHPSCAYARMDFETDEEFSSCFGRYRIIMSEVIRMISALNPTIPFQYCDHWLKTVLSRPIQEKVHKNSQVYLELDAIQYALEAILGKLNPKEELTPILSPGLELLKLCLDFNAMNDPMLLSVLLSCISSLFAVVTVTPDALSPTLTCIFKCITFKKEAPEQNDEIRMLRRHGCALLVKIATRHPQTLVPVFEFLRQTIVDDLYIKAKALSRMEFVTLIEGLVLVSNEFKNYDAQSRFIESLAKPVCDQFKSLEQCFVNLESFMNHIGFDRSKDVSEQRAEIAFCLNFFVAVFRRASVPNDLQCCKESGFIDPTITDVMALRNPASGVGCHILETVLKLTKTFIDLFKHRSNPALSKILDMLELEKANVHGVNNSDDNKSDSGCQQEEEQAQDQESRKLQFFIVEQFENLFHVLAQSCQLFGHQFYKQPGLAGALVTFVFQEVQHLPDYRMRPVIRMFLKTLINKCPKSCFGPVLAPVLTTICPHMYTRLEEKWKLLKLARDSPTFDENNTDSQEVIDDVIGRQITREYLDVMKAILTSGGGSDLKASDPLSASSESLNNKGGSHNLALSDLGQVVMQHEGLCNVLTKTLLNALSWPDSISSQRASNQMEMIIPILASNEQMSGADAVEIMIQILKALNSMGQYEMNNIALTSLSIQAYAHLRPKHQSVADFVASIDGVNVDDFKRFDDRVMHLTRESKEKANDKALKNMFKKTFGHIVGKDIAERFKKEVVIKNLPTLQLLKPRHKTPSLDETEHSELGITNLFSNGATKQNNSFTML